MPKDNVEINSAEDVVLEEKDEEIHNEKVLSRLVMLQFSIDQMALEVGSISKLSVFLDCIALI